MRLDFRTDPEEAEMYRAINPITGEDIYSWVMADEEAGEYEVLRLDENGDVLYDAFGKLVTDKYFSPVQLVMHDEPF